MTPGQTLSRLFRLGDHALPCLRRVRGGQEGSKGSHYQTVISEFSLTLSLLKGGLRVNAGEGYDGD